MKINTLSSSIKVALALSATITSLSTYAEEKKEDTSKVERIAITGSRISRVDLEATQPIETIDSDYINKRGTMNIASIMDEIPGVSLDANSTLGGNEAASTLGVGQSTVNLYGLGSQRTLSLVNGSRFVSSNAPVNGGSEVGAQVDVNNIPVSLIDRVEVVKVGGAPVYGADAVAGVVNFILKKDYEGAEFSADYTNIPDANAEDYSFRGLMGGNFNDDKGNLVVSFEYQDQQDILAKDVPSRVDQWTLKTPLGDDRVFDSNGEPVVGQLRLYPDPRAGILSNSGLVTPGGLGLVNRGIGAWPDGSFLQFDPSGNGQLIPYNTGTPTASAVWASGGDGLDLAQSNTAREGFERYNFTLYGNYKVTDDVNMTLLGFFNSSDAQYSGFQAAKYSSGAFEGLESALKFNTDYPYLSSEARNQLEGYLGGPGEFYVHKAWNSLGNRLVINESDVRSFKLGFDGYFELGDNEWKWDVFYQQGVSKIFSQGSGVNDRRFMAAMDVGYNDNTGAIDCKANFEEGYHDAHTISGFGQKEVRSLLGEVGNCQPLNPFGPVSGATLDYVTYVTMSQARMEQDIFQAFLSGDIIELPAGYIGAAFGFEHRTESARFYSASTAELNSGIEDSSTSGEYTTKDFFVETNIPLISDDMDIVAIDHLSVDASYRRIDNDVAGADNVWAVGLNYQPIDNLMIRANYSETVRSPSVGELYRPRILESLFGTDPCDINQIDKGTNPTVRRKNCEAAGVPDGYKAVSGNASRNGYVSGNPNLVSEQAEGLNIGLVYSPEWIEGFSFRVDYISIDITDAIVSFNLTDIMQACYDATNYPNEYCSMFKRGNDFQVPGTNAFEAGFVNAALLEFETYEYEVQFKRSLNDYPFVGDLFPANAGEFGIKARVYNLKKDAESKTGFDFEDNTGEYDNPDWRGDLKLSYFHEDISAYLDVVYHGEGNVNNDSTNPLDYVDQYGTPFSKIDSYTLFNLGAAYHFSDNAVVRFRVDNLLDWYPDQKELEKQRFTFGRTFNVGVTYKF